MYFWKTHQLVSDLTMGSLKERDLKNYYLATSFLISVAYYAALLGPRENLYALAVEAIGVLAVMIVGLNVAFTANGGASGTRFLEKIIAISFPLLVKFLIAGFVLGILVVLLEVAGLDTGQVEWVLSISTIVLQVAFFSRLVTHVKKTNA